MRANERRIYPRIPYRASTLIKSEFSDPMEGGTVDVSRGGALLDSPFPFGVGHDVILNFATGHEPITGVGARVKRSRSAFWDRRFLIAVEFEELMDDLVQLAEVRSTNSV